MGLVVRIAASFGGARESNEGRKSWSAFGPGGGYTGVDECENSWSCTPKTFAFNICHIWIKKWTKEEIVTTEKPDITIKKFLNTHYEEKNAKSIQEETEKILPVKVCGQPGHRLLSDAVQRKSWNGCRAHTFGPLPPWGTPRPPSGLRPSQLCPRS